MGRKARTYSPLCLLIFRIVYNPKTEVSKKHQNDVIQGIIEAAPPNTSLYNLCIRILYLDFSAIHTTTISITHALHDLVTHTEFQDPIRDEIECVLRNSGGWTKQALKDMRKLDSSLKESQRLHPVTTGRHPRPEPSCLHI